MSVMEARMGQREAEKTRAEHPLPDPLSEDDWAWVQRNSSFPDRQYQVVRLMCRACTDAEIAEIIGIDSNTVRMHVRKVLQRLNVRTRMGALIMVIDRRRSARPGDTNEGALK